MTLKLHLTGQPLPETRFTYDWKDCALYALGVGATAGGVDAAALRLTWEADPAFAVVPSFAVLPATQMVMDGLRAIDADFRTLVHGAQHLELHRPLPRPVPHAVTLRTAGRIAEIQDKGKGAVVVFETETFEVGAEHPAGAREGAAEGPLFTTRWSIFCRTQGGFGGPRGEKATLPEALADAAPVAVVVEPTGADQALLYRLSGDHNPLHVDPALATRVGFARPILHGLCTYGYAVRAAVAAVAGGDGGRLAAFGARFADVVYPGEVLSTTVRPTAAADTFVLEVRAGDRVVLDQGVARVRPA